jgi:hypothetical protein
MRTNKTSEARQLTGMDYDPTDDLAAVSQGAPRGSKKPTGHKLKGMDFDPADRSESFDSDIPRGTLETVRLTGVKKIPWNRQEQPDRKKEEKRPVEDLKESISKVRSIPELIFILESVSDDTDVYNNLAEQILELDRQLRENIDTIIINDIITPKLAEKDPAAKKFAESYLELYEPGDLRVKDKVKALMKEKLEARFKKGKESVAEDGRRQIEPGPQYYGRLAIEQLKSYDQLKYVAGQFKKVKLAGGGENYIDGNSLAGEIDESWHYLETMIEHQKLLTLDADSIKYEIESALATFPRDQIGIFEKTREIFQQRIDSLKPAETPKAPGGVIQSIKSRFSGWFRK